MTAYVPSEPEATIADEARFQTTNLEERGRVQFFFHSPLSKLPVRDVTNEQGYDPKTEPYIEKRAENYCGTCYQDNNIVPFAKSNERYLFLMTTCKDKNLPQYDKRWIVGYIEKENVLDMNGHYAIQGPTSLYEFEDAIPFSKFDDTPKNTRMFKFNQEQTQYILKNFSSKEDVYSQCVKRVNELKSVPAPDTEEFSQDSSGC